MLYNSSMTKYFMFNLDIQTTVGTKGMTTPDGGCVTDIGTPRR